MSKLETPKPATVVALEFVVGVTGHRDCISSDTLALKEQITAALVNLRIRFNHLPVRVVTGLAEGADTIVTEVALDLGMPVTAVLPMPREEYEKDFSGTALKTFQQLADDERISVFSLPVHESNTQNGLGSDASRVAQYEMLKDFLIRRSNLLLALWDGKPMTSKGGTSDVISAFLSGHSKHNSPTYIQSAEASFEDCGDLAIWIKTPRSSDPDYVKIDRPSYLVSDSSGMVFTEMKDIPPLFKGRWSGFDSYAQDRYSENATGYAAYPLVEAGDDTSPQEIAINREFVRADQLALANQKSSDGLFKAFGLIAGAMGLFFLVYAKLAALKIYLVLYVLLFVAGYLAFRIGANKRWLGRHLSYRALAETMRVQYFMLVSGVGKSFSPRHVVSLTSVDRFKGFEWLQDAVRCMEPLTFDNHMADHASLDAVHRNWVEDQSNYFTRKLNTLHAQHKRLESIKAALMLGSVIGAIALIFFKYSLYDMHMAGYDGKTWLVFMMGLLPLWLAVWELYQGKMATRELIWQYANQRRYFVAAMNQMDASEDVETRLRVVADLAERALAEIYLWSAHRFHREHEPPAAG